MKNFLLFSLLVILGLAYACQKDAAILSDDTDMSGSFATSRGDSLHVDSLHHHHHDSLPHPPHHLDSLHHPIDSLGHHYLDSLFHHQHDSLHIPHLDSLHHHSDTIGTHGPGGGHGGPKKHGKQGGHG